MLKSFGNDLYVAGQAIRVPFLGKSKSGFPNPKMDFAFVWANPRRDHESIKSTLLVTWILFSQQILYIYAIRTF